MTQLYDPKETAKLLAISDRKLWSLTASGEIASVRIGRSVRYSQQAIEAFIESNTEPVR